MKAFGAVDNVSTLSQSLPNMSNKIINHFTCSRCHGSRSIVLCARHQPYEKKKITKNFLKCD